ncbi:MAG TPA: hypothetical protein DD713_05815 [Nitrospiraceae bacterium]|nr:hypothetical protein [Nitrospiraceae bacterium]
MKWPMVKLGEVLTERKEVPSQESLLSGSVRIVEKIGFNDGKIQLRIDGKTKTGMILIHPGDIVVSGINAAKGAIAIYGKEHTGPITATIHYGAYIPNKERVDINFLWWLLRSRTFKELLLEYVPGGIKTELKAKRFLPIPVPIPSLSEQKRILARIEELAKKVEEAQRHKIKATHEAQKYMNACLYSIMSTLNSTAHFQEVITFKPRSGPSFVTAKNATGIPVLMPSAVTGFGVNPQKVEYSIEPALINEKDRLMAGDILIARGNKIDQVGNAGIVPSDCANWVCANLLMRLQIDTARVDRNFCIYWLRSPQIRTLVRQQMSGTNPNIQKINQQKILAFPFPAKTPLSDQRRIIEYLDSLQSKVDELKKLQSETQKELNALMPSILDKAFKGEL